MASQSRRLAAAALAAITLVQAVPATASYLYWVKPSFAGEPVRGDEPGIGITIPKATPKELQAHLLWNMRAGLNVAALQCQFSPSLMTVRNYNDILRHHGQELNDAYAVMNGYFKRTAGKTWQTQFDQYTTKTYNGFSTLHAQYGFCETAAAIGRDAIGRRKGDLHTTAETRMREFRNSLVPMGDALFASHNTLAARQLVNLAPQCWDKKGRYDSRKCG